MKKIDAKGRTLGRVASEAAVILMGKDKAKFERNVYSGEAVEIINSSKIMITAKKLDQIMHLRYSGYPGGLRRMKGTEVREKKGMKELLSHAKYQMLPSNKLRREMMKNLKIEE
mgnify:FL=1